MVIILVHVYSCVFCNLVCVCASIQSQSKSHTNVHTHKRTQQLVDNDNGLASGQPRGDLGHYPPPAAHTHTHTNMKYLFTDVRVAATHFARRQADSGRPRTPPRLTQPLTATVVKYKHTTTHPCTNQIHTEAKTTAHTHTHAHPHAPHRHTRT